MSCPSVTEGAPLATSHLSDPLQGGTPELRFTIIIIIIIIHEFHRDASLETKLQGRYVSRITLQL